MNRNFIAALFCLCLIFISGCAQKKDYVVTIKTNYGDMVAILYDETPQHKANFIKLAKEHYFDSLLFHRVIKGFMIQGGDPESKKAQPGKRLGNGGPGYTIPAEINSKYFHEKGALSAARLGDQQNPSKASSGSQFYIVQGVTANEAELKTDQMKLDQAMGQYFQNPANKATYDSVIAVYQSNDVKAFQSLLMKLKPRVEKETGVKTDREISPEKVKVYSTVGGTPGLDGEYTVFGKVIKGLEVIDKIASQAGDEANRPVEDIRMTVAVEELSRKKIEKLYGYQFPENK
jgi:peptidyl-prolyl cis-trans isomerase B (cyclophilin B)